MNVRKRLRVMELHKRVTEHKEKSAYLEAYLSIKRDEGRVKQSEAMRYLDAIGLRKNLLRLWTKKGLLHPVKKGTAQNSAKWYSVMEINAVIERLLEEQFEEEIER